MASSNDHFLLVYITAPDRESALAIAAGLVENRLAAGANVAGPIYSSYRWRDAICQAQEWQIFAQTTARNFDALSAWVAENHPHEVPCVISTQIIHGHSPFLQWIAANVRGVNACGKL